MPAWQWVAVTSYGVLALIAVLRHGILTLAIKKMRFLTPSSPRIEKDFPFLSIIVPAKDEAHGIRACVDALLAQSYPRFEIIVVDDRSADGTADIVEEIARRDSRVRLERVRDLPAGWTGKTHALDQAQRSAKGEWLLFVDADTILEPCCATVALFDAIDHRVDLESLLPALEARSFWEFAVQPFASACLMVLFPIDRVNRPHHVDMGFANGQFILIRRSAYDQIGGHRAVRDKFVEDIHLGRLIRRAGLGLRVVMGRDVAKVRMYSNLSAIVKGWSRILYSAVDFRPAKLVALLVATTVFSVLSYVMVAGFGWAFLLGARGVFVETMLALALVHQLAQTTIMARLYRLSASSLWCLPLRIIGVAVTLWILVRTIILCRTHQVSWRGDLYTREIQRAATPS